MSDPRQVLLVQFPGYREQPEGSERARLTCIQIGYRRQKQGLLNVKQLRNSSFSGLDLDATLQTLAIIDAARERRRDRIKVILVPNRLDRRTLEGRQLLDELSTFGEAVGPPIASRAAFVRCFTSGQSVASYVPGDTADREIQELADAIEQTDQEE